MSKRILWMPGWASDFAQWKTLIHGRWPWATHDFVDYARMVREYDCLQDWPEVQSADIIVSWSLGSLLALRVASKLTSPVALVALCPFAWFCEPALGWPERVVLRMAAQLRKDPLGVLTQFSLQMGDVNANERKEWIERARKMEVEMLAQGLELLATLSVTHASALSAQRKIHLVAGAVDEIVSPELTIALARELNPQSLQMIPEMNHWPFSAAWELPGISG